MEKQVHEIIGGIPKRDYEAGSMTLNILGGLGIAFLGMLCNLSLLLAPVHEIGHFLAAIITGAGNISLDWTTVYYSGRNSVFVSAAGFVFEAFVWCYIQYRAFKSGRFWLYCFFFGVLFVVPLHTWMSLDYLYGDFRSIERLWSYTAVVVLQSLFWTTVAVFYFLAVAMLEKFGRRERIQAENLAYWEELQARQRDALTPMQKREG